jgi:RNA polymerase sigma-70 factor (ECF subfamily)
MSDRPDLPLSPEETADLVERVKRGDRAALDRLLARVLPRLQRWARGRVPAGARGMLDTADLVQDVLVKALPQLDAFEVRGSGAFLAYLRRCVLNRIEDERRRLGRRPAVTGLPADLPNDETSPLDQLIGLQKLQRFEAAFARLSDADQAAIIGRFEWRYGFQELAVALGKPSPDAARIAVRRAVERLVAQVEPV